jgi:hypothetical protein
MLWFSVHRRVCTEKIRNRCCWTATDGGALKVDSRPCHRAYGDAAFTFGENPDGGTGCPKIIGPPSEPRPIFQKPLRRRQACIKGHRFTHRATSLCLLAARLGNLQQKKMAGARSSPLRSQRSKIGAVLPITLDTTMPIARSGGKRVLAEAPGAVTAASRRTSWWRRIVPPVPHGRYLSSVAIGVVPTVPARISDRHCDNGRGATSDNGHDASANRLGASPNSGRNATANRVGATDKQSAKAESTDNRGQQHGFAGQILTHIGLRG